MPQIGSKIAKACWSIVQFWSICSLLQCSTALARLYLDDYNSPVQFWPSWSLLQYSSTVQSWPSCSLLQYNSQVQFWPSCSLLENSTVLAPLKLATVQYSSGPAVACWNIVKFWPICSLLQCSTVLAQLKLAAVMQCSSDMLDLF